MRFQFARSARGAGSRPSAEPALLTTQSISAKAEGRVAIARSTAARSCTSRASGRTASPSSLAKAASLSLRRAVATTRAPLAAKRRTSAAPKPALAPVTKMVIRAWPFMALLSSTRTVPDQDVVQRLPARRVRRQQQATGGLARRIGRAVEPCAMAAGLTVDELAGRVVPRVEPVIKREMCLAARQRKILVTGAAEIEDRADEIGATAEAACQSTVAEPHLEGAAHAVRRRSGSDREPPALAPRPLARHRRRRHAFDRIMNPRRDRLAAADQRNHDGEHRDAGGEIGGAVDWVDDPDGILAVEQREHGRIGGNPLLAAPPRARQPIAQRRRQPPP